MEAAAICDPAWSLSYCIFIYLEKIICRGDLAKRERKAEKNSQDAPYELQDAFALAESFWVVLGAIDTHAATALEAKRSMTSHEFASAKWKAVKRTICK